MSMRLGPRRGSFASGEAFLVEALFGDHVLLARLIDEGRAGRAVRVGYGVGADVPVPADVVGAPVHELVRVEGGRCVLALSAETPARIVFEDRSETRVATETALPTGARATISCGPVEVRVVAADAVPEVPRRAWGIDPGLRRMLMGTGAALGLVLLAILSVPPDPKSLSLDLYGGRMARAEFQIIPSEVPPPPVVAGPRAASDGAAKANPRSAPPARTGGGVGGNARVDTAPRSGGQPDPRKAGILPFLQDFRGGALAAVFAADEGPGLAGATLGPLVAVAGSGTFGPGGFGEPGTGGPGAGEGERTRGDGRIGTRGGHGDDPYGQPGIAARLGARRPPTIEVIPGVIAPRGVMDKEIIRRVVRAHLNEVKFCYEQELVRRPGLGGRVSVRFTIDPVGRVMASVVEASTMGDARVEGCVTNAVKRWQFPKPAQAGLTIVTYPFVFATPGGP